MNYESITDKKSQPRNMFFAYWECALWDILRILRLLKNGDFLEIKNVVSSMEIRARGHYHPMMRGLCRDLERATVFHDTHKVTSLCEEMAQYILSEGAAS